MTTRGVRRIVFVFLLALVAGGLAWWLRPSRPLPLRPNVLLITIDTLRADRLGCAGYAAARTPVLDGLAGRGVRFTTAIAHTPLTAPSHASILTALSPLRHGVRNNGGFVLPESIPTLAEDFAHAGYRTAAFVSGFPLDRRFGFARGFDVYDDHLPHGDDPRRAPYVERPADQTTQAVRQWLDAPGPAGDAREPIPWFAWVHYYDPHAPYEAPADARSGSLSPYDAEVAFVDAQIGVLLRRLEETGAATRTLVLVTSDHGEGLGEHGEETHGIFLYDSTLRVPWIMAGPGIPAGRVAATVARGIDVAPTLLEYAAVPSAAPREGRSLRPAAEGRAMTDEPAYAESLFAQLHLGWAPLHTLRTARWKIVDAPRAELYDLHADPGELRDLATTDPVRTSDLQRQVQALLKTPVPAAAAQVSSDTAERLGALGYLGGGVTAPIAPAGAAGRRNPRDGLALIHKLEQGMEEVRTDPARAVRNLGDVLREDAGVTLARRYRAVALAALGRHADAIADFRVLEKAGPLSAEDLMVLGDSLRVAGRGAEALEALDQAARLQPRSALPWINRGNLLLKDGRLDAADAAYQRALSLVPDHVEALRGRGDVAVVRGDSAQAAQHFERILTLAPQDAGAMVKVGVMRMRGGQAEAAIALFRRALEQQAANAEALLYLAGALAATGRPAEAVPLFERALARGPRTTMALNGLGFTRLDLGDGRGAEAALRESLSMDPNQPEVAEALREIRRAH